MDFELSEEARSVSELAREILEDLITNERLKIFEADPTESFDRQAYRALAESGLLGVAIPEEFGGMGLDFDSLCQLCQEIGRSVAPVPVYAALVLGALPLVRFGSAEDKREWLPRIARGEEILTAALLELDSSNPYRPTTRAERTQSGFRISGEKSLVPYAGEASRILVSAALDGETALFWVDPTREGLRIEAQTSSDGQPHGHLSLDGVDVLAHELLGGKNEGASPLRWLVERATIARCATQIGVTERALEMTADYGRERVQFDRPIGSFQAFHQRAADAYIEVEGIRLTTWEAIWRLCRDLEARDSVQVAKFVAAEGAAFSAYACQHLHGGVGIDMDYPLHRYFTWATQIEHELGSARVQLAGLGDRIASGDVVAF